MGNMPSVLVVVKGRMVKMRLKRNLVTGKWGMVERFRNPTVEHVAVPVAEQVNLVKSKVEL